MQGAGCCGSSGDLGHPKPFHNERDADMRCGAEKTSQTRTQSATDVDRGGSEPLLVVMFELWAVLRSCYIFERFFEKTG
jgi:hypothetical protein